jgi:translation initiation factor IF-2
MNKDVRVQTFARDLELDINDVIEGLREIGIIVKNKYSKINAEQAKKYKDELERKKRKISRETRIKGGAVIRRKAAPKPEVKKKKIVVSTTKTSKPAVKKPVKKSIKKPVKAAKEKPVEIAEVIAVEKSVEKVAEKIAKPAKKVAAKPTKKPTKKATAKTVEVKDSVPKKSVPKKSVPEKDKSEIKLTEKVEVKKESESKLKQDNKDKKIEKPEVKKDTDKKIKKETFSKVHKPKRLMPLPARPEASATPIDRSGAKKKLSRNRKEISGDSLGPTGRFIVLPKSTRTLTKVDSSKESDGGGQVQRDRRGKGAQTSYSYKQKKKDAELLKKAGPTPKKKTKTERPAIPPEGKRKIRVDEFVSVLQLSKDMGLKAGEVIKKLISLGQIVNINTSLDIDTASIIASEWGFEVENIGFLEEKFLKDEVEVDVSKLIPRHPIVTIMGHVDHGKTSLLDVIRKSDIVAKESGGITQHIGAYKVKTKEGEIVFIDTPGHEAFSAMRSRGASVTDIVILVCAADDGVMPQTVEAINHCKDAKVPIIVAITKIDKNNANPQMVREKLTAHGILDENWGGTDIIVEVSSIAKTGIDHLLEMVILQSEMLELKANPDTDGMAVVLEGKLDKSKGPIVNILVKNGTLKVGDPIIVGTHSGKIRTLVDDRGRQVKSVGPATPIELSGISGVPAPGEELRVVVDEKIAKKILEKRRENAKVKELARKSQAKGMDAIRLAIARGEQKQLNVILKTDVQGTMEAITDSLVKLSTEKVKVNVVHGGVGGINETDINLAITSNSIVLGFRVRPASKARHKAENEAIEVKPYNVIYDMINDVKDIMRGLLPKEKKEILKGKIEVRKVIHIPKVGTIAGCYVLEGKVSRVSQLRLYRDNIQLHEGKVSSLKRFKDDVKEVAQGYECGLGFDNYSNIKEGDLLEIYEYIEVQVEL